MFQNLTFNDKNFQFLRKKLFPNIEWVVFVLPEMWRKLRMCNNKDNLLFMFIKKRNFFPKKCNFLVSNLDFDIANSFAIGLFLFLEEKGKKERKNEEKKYRFQAVQELQDARYYFQDTLYSLNFTALFASSRTYTCH